MLQATRLRVVHGVLVAFAAALLLRAAWVQLWQGERWERLAASQHYARNALPAPRGEILDVAGVPLAQSEVRVHLDIAPQEVKEPRRLARDLKRLGIDAATVARAIDRRRKWVEIQREFMPSEVAVVSAMKGVHPKPSVQRDYVPLEGMRRIVGRTADGAGQDGIELVLDSLLRGERGSTRALLGARGQRYESLDAMSQPPRAGHSVTLTVSYVMQDICDRALADAEARLGISGGDIVVLEPARGEIRCLASRRQSGLNTASLALTEPFEPGSTLKPFLAGRMVEEGVARLDEVIDTYNGKFSNCGHEVTDIHKAARLSLADVIRYSSNVGIMRFTARLPKREVFETLRDFGFGMPTGIAYPSEAAGVLREPRFWSCPSQGAISTGYEISVTAVQLAAAYAAIANDGLLVVPTLVKSIRDADGNMIFEHTQPQVVRRVMQPKTARALRDVLASVVDSGTATDAGLATFDLGGKSGTARRVSGGVYKQGSYTSTFVGLFPAKDPQYVVLVKLDNPKGTIFGGKTAAPVAKAILEAAIAARGGTLDRGDLASQRARYVPPVDAQAAGRRRVAAAGRVGADSPTPTRYALVDSTPVAPPVRVRFDLREQTEPPEPRDQVTVPDVRGLPARVVARELHRAGLRVSFVSGVPFEVSPPPGAVVAGGTLVKVARR